MGWLAMGQKSSMLRTLRLSFDRHLVRGDGSAAAAGNPTHQFTSQQSQTVQNSSAVAHHFALAFAVHKQSLFRRRRPHQAHALLASCAAAKHAKTRHGRHDSSSPRP